MENAADALIIAGAVFVLIIILSVTTFAFSNARLSLDNIFALSDKESQSIQGDKNYYYLSTSGQNENLTRTVGADEIIPSIYRAFYENYKIEFIFKDGDYYLYQNINQKDDLGAFIKVKSIDLSEITVSDSQKENLIEAILYNRYNNNTDLTKFNEDFLGNRHKN